MKTNYTEAFDIEPFKKSISDSCSKDPSFILRVASIWIDDVVKGRLPCTRILYNTKFFNTFNITPLRVYTIIHSTVWRKCMQLFTCSLIFLSQLEYHYPYICIGFEIFIFIFYAVDAIFRRFCSDGKKILPSFSYIKKWDLLRDIFIIITCIDIFISLIFYISGHHEKVYRPTRYLRTFFLIEKGRILRQLMSVVLSTVSSVWEVCTKYIYVYI